MPSPRPSFRYENYFFFISASDLLPTTTVGVPTTSVCNGTHQRQHSRHNPSRLESYRSPNVAKTIAGSSPLLGTAKLLLYRTADRHQHPALSQRRSAMRSGPRYRANRRAIRQGQELKAPDLSVPGRVSAQPVM